MTTAFPHLLAPGAIGTLVLRNRILMAPMGDALANADGTVSDAQLAYFEARARGGAALLLVGSVAVAYPDGCVDERQVGASRPEHEPGLARLADVVHRHGAALAAQLTLNGALARLDLARGRPMLVPAVPPRPHPDALSMMITESELAGYMAPYSTPTARIEYRVATDDDLAWVIERFANAADRCRRVGIDGVELHAGHGYLIDEFLSPASNPRTDAWGGDVDGRARLLLEVVRGVRARVGPDYPLWMRINAREYHKDHGERFPEQVAVIERAVAAGLDAVHVTAYANLDVATGPTDSYAPHRVGELPAFAAQVRARVDVPVITFGRLEPDEAEAVLAAGDADFVAMGRKLLADPELPNRLAAGEPERIRPCLYQYRCIGNIFVNESLACVVNAATGREHEATVPRATRHRRVLVVGGGAAGLEAARVLADHGHHVELHEAGPVLGGVLADVHGADPVLDRQLTWLVGEVERRSVELHLTSPIELAALDADRADAVVLATGPRWTRPSVPGAERVLAPPQLGGWFRDGPDDAIGRRVVLLGGGKPALTLAGALAARGRDVTIVEETTVLGPELGLPGRFRLVADAEAAGVHLLTGSTVRAVGPATVTVLTGSNERDLAADTVLATTRVAPPVPSPGVVPLHVVGDARAARGFEGITRDAEWVARELAS